ncbi:MAG: glycosyltransferase family 4 protein, partial [Deltaproteobacteria bacterium]|nr:glycosyltransferase family 4 protein [Deltaproteobacteria bacterium]
MKIGFDCSAALLDQRTGVGNYSFLLIRALSKIDKENEYLLYPFFYHIFGDFRNKCSGLPEASNYRIAFRNIPVPTILLRYIWLAGIPPYLKEYFLGDVDVVHSNTFSAPHFKNKRKRLVVTIYDLTVLTHPECHRKANIVHCLKGTKDAIKYADAIIAISEHTKRDLIEYLGAPPELVTVTHLAAGDDYYEVTDGEVLRSGRERYRLPENYILFVGSLEPRKNIKTLLKAYAGMEEGFKKDFPLVIAGGKGWMNSDIPEMVKGLDVEDRVVFAGFIDGADIAAVYSQAVVFAYPSLYEGFGLPILEAMSCGAPVITSNTSSMPEVAGDAAVLVDPTDAGALASALEGVLGDPAKRGEMRKKGLEQASRFSWDRCAKETLDV